MTYHDDEELDRALFALPLEPLPEGLRASILATVSVVPGPILTAWEIAGVGVILALAAWLSILMLTAGTGGNYLGASVGALGAGLTRAASDPTTLAWLAVGGSSAVWLSLVSFPGRLATIRQGVRR